MNFIQSAAGAYLTYKAVTILRTPWNELEIYKLGLVDEKGVQLKKTSKMSAKEKSWFTLFHKFLYEIKRISELNLYNKFTFWRKINMFSLVREGDINVLRINTSVINEKVLSLTELNDVAGTGVSANAAILALNPTFVSRDELDLIKSGKRKPRKQEELFFCAETQESFLVQSA